MNSDPDARDAFNDAIRAAFEALEKDSGKSRYRWAKDARVAENYPKQVVEGSVRSLTLEKANQLCSGLGVTLWDLLAQADPNGAVDFRSRRPHNDSLEDFQGVDAMEAERMILRRLERLETAHEKMADMVDRNGNTIEEQGGAIVEAIERLGDRLMSMLTPHIKVVGPAAAAKRGRPGSR